MGKKLFLFLLTLLLVATRSTAQQICHLLLIPEGDNICYLAKPSSGFSAVRACRGNSVCYRAILPTAGQHQSDIEVQWGAPESGYGMLYLDGTMCDCECKSRKSIKVPVVSGNVLIQGADTLCVEEQGEYSVPLWGGTEYTWSVNPSIGVDIDTGVNRLMLTPHVPMIYTVEVTYNCSFLGCGPYTVTKTVVALDSLEIVPPGTRELCVGDRASFTTTNMSLCQWTVTKDEGRVHAETGISMDYTFDSAGVFVVAARNARYCNKAQVTVVVHDVPPSPTFIEGPDSICPGYAAVYASEPTSPDYYILWEWTADGEQHSYSGNRVSIQFGSTVEDVSVYQVHRRTGCRSEATVYHVSPFQLAGWPYNGIVKVCEGQEITLSRLYDQFDQGVLYEWTTHDPNIVSIQGTHLTSDVTLLANYTSVTPTMVTFELNRRYCETYQNDYLHVLVGAIDAPAIVHAPPCENESVTFRAENSDDVDVERTYWDIVGEPNTTRYGMPVTFRFDDASPRVVHLHYVSKYGCEADRYDTVYPCDPLPPMHIERDPDSHTLRVVIAGGEEGYRFRWMTGETGSSIVSTAESYECIVTSLDCGCIRKLSHMSSTGGCIEVSNPFGIEVHCKNIISIDHLYAPGLSYPIDITLMQGGRYHNYTIFGPNQRIRVPQAGSFSIDAAWSDDDTCYHGSVSGCVDEALNIMVLNDCQGHLEARGSVPGHQTPLAVSVYRAQTGSQVGTQSGTNRVFVSISDTGWYSVHMEFENNPNCYFDTLVHFDAPPVIQDVYTLHEMCEQTAYTFIADAVGEGLTYEWDFGDDSWNYGNGIDHVFGPVLSRSMGRTITLTVTDRNGCSVSAEKVVSINSGEFYYQNYSLGQTFLPICPGDSAVLSVTQGNNSYAWIPCSRFTSTVAYVYATGNYVVDITSNMSHCRKQIVRNVPYPNGPFASIGCDSTYCQNDEAVIFGNVGSDFSYRWYLHSAHTDDSAFTPNLTCLLGDTGQYRVILWVTDAGGCVSNDTAFFYVHPTPPAPVILFGSNHCITDGPVDLVSANGETLLWSNGTKGTTTLFYTDGLAAGYYIDESTGCRSHKSTIEIPKAPNFDDW